MGQGWFPGHAAKARRTIRENLKLVDLVIEVADARLPLSSRSPDLIDLIGAKHHLLVLTRSDLADPVATSQWADYWNSTGLVTQPVNAVSGEGVEEIVSSSRRILRDRIASLEARGVRNYIIRAMVVGLPNVGKSSLINRLVGRKTARTGDIPGITRGKQWVRLRKDLELLDMPGILAPGRRERETILLLAAVGAFPSENLDPTEVALQLLRLIPEKAWNEIRQRYGVDVDPAQSGAALESIGRSRGFLLPGGEVDTSKAATALIKDFQAGKLGRITLEWPFRSSKP